MMPGDGAVMNASAKPLFMPASDPAQLARLGLGLRRIAVAHRADDARRRQAAHADVRRGRASSISLKAG